MIGLKDFNNRVRLKSVNILFVVFLSPKECLVRQERASIRKFALKNRGPAQFVPILAVTPQKFNKTARMGMGINGQNL